jgi:hypothetical protein
MTEEVFPGEREMVPDMSSLRFGQFEEGEAQRILSGLPDVPGDADDVLVVTSLRISTGLHRRLKSYAEERGVAPSVLIRQWIELHLASDDKPISLDAALRALAALPRSA